MDTEYKTQETELKEEKIDLSELNKYLDNKDEFLGVDLDECINGDLLDLFTEVNKNIKSKYYTTTEVKCIILDMFDGSLENISYEIEGENLIITINDSKIIIK